MATKRNLIDISNHPDLDGVTRKVEIFGCHNQYRNNRVALEIEVFHYKDGKEQTKLDGVVYLYAENDKAVVMQTGQDADPDVVIDKNGNWPAGIMGEYDYLFYLIKNNLANQLTLEELYVAKRIEKINEKLYTKS